MADETGTDQGEQDGAAPAGDLMDAGSAAAQNWEPGAQLDQTVGGGVEHKGVAHLQVQHGGERHLLLVEHGLDLGLGGPKLGGQVAFPDIVAAELLTHELLQ
jgi:hypothetical protein